MSKQRNNWLSFWPFSQEIEDLRPSKRRQEEILFLLAALFPYLETWGPHHKKLCSYSFTTWCYILSWYKYFFAIFIFQHLFRGCEVYKSVWGVGWGTEYIAFPKE